MNFRASHRRGLVLAGALTAASAATALTPAGAQEPDPTGSTSTTATSLATTAPTTAPTTTATVPTSVPTTTIPDPSAAPDQAPSTVSVTGRGEGVTTPDLGVLTMGVEVRAATVAEAQQQAAERASAVIEALRDAGIDEQDLQTAGIEIRPQYRYPDDAAPVAEGYVVRNTLQVQVRDVSRIGEAIDAAVAAGGDSTIVSGIRFEASDPGAALETARQEAWRDAVARAQQLAELSGGELGRVLSIDEQTTGGAPPVPVERTDVATPIQPGSVSATVTLSVRFELVTGPPPTSEQPAAEASTDARS